MDQSTDGDISEGEAISDLGSYIGTADHSLAYLEALGSDHVSFLTIGIVEECDTCRAVGIVFDRHHLSGHIIVDSLEVDETQFSLMAAAAIAGREVT